MKNILRNLLLIFILINISTIFSQSLKGFGVKIGPTLTGIYNNSNYDVGSLNKISYDASIYGEFLQHKRISVVTELHISVKGENQQDVPYSVQSLDLYNFNSVFRYLSFEPLFKYRFYVGKESSFYTLLGPRVDMKISNYESESVNGATLENNMFEFGGTFVIGTEFNAGLIIELRYEPNFSSIYKFTNPYVSYSTRHTTISLLTGLNFKLLR